MPDISQITLPDSNTYNLIDATVPHTSETAASGGTALSLVTTGEKYVWNSSSALSGLSDVAITSVTNDEILQYNSTSGKWENKDAKADRVPLPAEYDPTVTYHKGDFCTYNGDIYYCNYDMLAPEAWDSTHWIQRNPQRDYLHSIDPVGFGSFSLNRKEGTTIGPLSFAEGRNTTASGYYCHAEGDGCIASGDYSHAEGVSSKATREESHAEGGGTTASGIATHAEGWYTTAHGSFSHAEGKNTASYGEGSHVEGLYTTATHRSQHLFGEYNVLDTSPGYGYDRGNYVEIVGNGTADDARSNARTLDWSGNEVLAGNLKINSTQDVAAQVSLTQAEYDALVSAGTVDLINTIYFITDADAIATSATEVSYSNTTSGMLATNVQSAIDEVVSDIPTKTSDLTNDSDFATISQVSAVGNGLKFAHITTTSDGRYYTASFGGFVTTYERVPVLVIHANQTSGSVYAPEIVTITKQGNCAFQSGAHVSTSQSYRFTIDNGQNAWSPPIVIYPSTLCSVSSA